MKKIHFPSLFLIIAMLQPLLGTAAQRQALVIGNDSYPGNSLRNARHDAQAIADALGSLGYITLLQTDVTRRVLEDSVDTFANRLNAGDTAVLFYSGHGLQVDGENYLVPIDFRASSPADVKYQGYSLSQIVEKLAQHGASTQIVILDSCRDNPFLGTRSLGRGWAGVGTSAGTFLAFGTGPGSTASDNPMEPNGLFTSALLRYLKSATLDINAMFEKVREDVIRESHALQVPWTASSLIGAFYMVPPTGLPPLLAEDTVSTSEATTRSLISGTQQSSAPFSQADSGPILINQGLLLAERQNYEEAIRSLSAAAAANPASSIALRILGLIFHLMARNTEAVGEFNQALSVNPNDAKAYYYRCLSTGSTDAVSAVRDCQAALGLQPNFPEAHLGLANAFVMLSQLNKAYDESNIAIELTPNSPLAYSMRGKVNALMGHYPAAQRDYDTAVRLTGTSVEEK